MKYQKWNIGAPQEEDVAALREAGYPYLMALVLAARGVASPETAAEFLDRDRVFDRLWLEGRLVTMVLRLGEVAVDLVDKGVGVGRSFATIMHTVSNIDERRQFREAYRRLIRAVGPVAETDDIASIHCLISGGINAGHYGRNGLTAAGCGNCRSPPTDSWHRGPLRSSVLPPVLPHRHPSIAHDLNQRKAARDAYIADFIAPVKSRLEAAGLKFEIKGRTKSISSIWNIGIEGHYVHQSSHQFCHIVTPVFPDFFSRDVAGLA